MNTPITEDDYRDEVQTQANVLATYAGDELDDPDGIDYTAQAVYEHVADVLDGHPWFHEAEHTEGDTFVRILSYAETDEMEFIPDGRAIDEMTVPEIIETLAYHTFRGEVVSTAIETLREQ